jgi:hypothetical protein
MQMLAIDCKDSVNMQASCGASRQLGISLEVRGG